MTPARTPRRQCLLVLAVLVTAVLPACGDVVEPDGPQLTVLTRNLYLGTGLDDAIGATTREQLVEAVTQDWANVLATDLPARAGALADEIAAARPDVVGLQEVTLWRDQTPGDITSTVTPNATHVVFDFLALLQAELVARDVPYTAVSASTNADVEFPRHGDSPTGLVDVRATDRDVILVRAGLAAEFGNPRHGHYDAVLRLPSVSGEVASLRGWASIDYRPGTRSSVRFLATHLEVQTPESAAAVQERQGAELLALVDASPYPVIALGDFNTPASGEGTPTYGRLTAVLRDAWAAARPTDAGPTCCQEELLTNRDGAESRRIDLILTSEDWPVDGASVVGDEPFQDVAPRWATDHLGVTARITIPR